MSAKKLTLEELRARIAERTKIKPVPVDPVKEEEPKIETLQPKEETKTTPKTTKINKIKLRDNTREAWLEAARDELRKEFKQLGFRVPDFRVSVGFNRDTRTKRMIGQTVPGNQTADGKPQVFVTPLANSGKDALTVLVYQIAKVLSLSSTASQDAIALRLGMCVNLKDTGPTAAPMIPGDRLERMLDALIERLGPYPHAAVLPTSDRKTRAMPLVYCSVSGPSGYKVRMSQSWIDKVGTPICPCHNRPMKVENK